MKTTIATRTSLLAAFTAVAAVAQSPKETIRGGEPVTSAASEAQGSLFPGNKYLIPDFTNGAESNEEIKTPEALTAEETMVKDSARNIPPEDLADLLEVYERMGNLAMKESLARILLERVPNHPVALKIINGPDSEAQIRKPDYLDKMAAEVLAGKASTDPDAVAAQARSLVGAKVPDQAIALLEALRRTTYPSRKFPFAEDLGFAYADRQQWKQAESAFSEALSQPLLPKIVSRRLQMHLDLVKVEGRIADIRERNYADPAAALSESTKLLEELPDHPSAIAFQVESLQYAGRNADSLALLDRLRQSYQNAPAFPYQRLLGSTYMQLKKWDVAQVEYEKVRDNPIFDKEARADATKSINNAIISSRGEEALIASGFGNWEKAESMMAELEQDFPNDLEVLSYRCALLGRMKKGDEALRILGEKKAQLASTGKPFLLQDTVGDVLLSQKKFDAARAANQVILDNPKYDWSLRRRALDAMPAIRRAELLEVAFLALRDRRIERARQAEQAMVAEFGENVRELKLLRSEILLAENKTTQAVDQLETLRSTTPSDRPFEAASSLATGYLRSGREKEALDAYIDILEHSRAYTPYENMQAKWEMRTAIPLAKAYVRAEVSHRNEGDGGITRADASYVSPWFAGGKWRAEVFTHADFIDLKTPLALQGLTTEEERFEAGVRVQRRLRPNLIGELTLGGSQDDIIYGARIGDFLTPGLAWSVGYTGNARSTESIPLEALNARENRIDVAFGGPLPGPWNFDLRASANWVRVGSTDVGFGIGASAALEYVLQTETEKRPEIAIGYLGEYRRFSPADDRSPLAAFIDQETNRHGLTASFRRNLNESWRLMAQVGGFYAFDESSFQYMAAIGLQYYFSDDWMAYMNFRYDSNSRTAAEDSGAYEVNLGMSKTF